MQEVFENIIKELEKAKDFKFLNDVKRFDEKERNAFDKAIEIVKKAAEEFVPDINVGNNDWIPVSEQFPEEDGEYEVTFEHTYHGDIKYKTKRAWFEKGYWSTQYNVVAWKNISKPYQPKGE